MFRIPKNWHGKTIKWMLILKLDLLHGPLSQLFNILTILAEIMLKSERHVTSNVN